MADDVSIQWGTSGFEKIAADFSNITKSVGEVKNALGTILGPFEQLFSVVMKVGAAFTGLAAVVVGVGAGSIMAFTNKVMHATEENRLLQNSLYGLTGSWTAVGKAADFAAEYAWKFAVTDEQLLKGIRDLALIPKMRPFIEEGDTEKMKGFLDTVMRLETIRPERGVEGAESAVTMAMKGRWRPLKQAYAISQEDVAAAAGMTKKEMAREGAPAIMAGLEKLTSQVVSVDAVTNSLKTFGKQLMMIKREWGEWIEDVGKTGIYDKVIDYLSQLQKALREFMQTDQMRAFTQEVGTFLENIADGIKRVLTSGIDWKSISSFSDLWEAIKQVAENVKTELVKIWEDVKEPLAEGLKDAFVFVAKAAYEAVKEIFLPIGKKIGESIVDGITDYLLKNPIFTAVLSAVPGGFALTSALTGARAAGISGREEEGKTPTATKERFFKERTLEEQPWYKQMWKEWLSPQRVAKAEIPWAPEFSGIVSHYQAWEGMAGTLAKAPIGAQEPQTASYLFATKKIGEQEYLQRKQYEAFEEERMEKMKTIAEAPGTPYAIRSQMYQQMFGIEAGRGRLGEAKEYMQKALDELVKAQMDATENGREQLAKTGEIADNTAKLVELASKEEGSEPNKNAEPRGEYGWTPTESGNLSDEVRNILENAGPWGAGY